jgi:hypothetical protein
MPMTSIRANYYTLIPNVQNINSYRINMLTIATEKMSTSPYVSTKICCNTAIINNLALLSQDYNQL